MIDDFGWSETLRQTFAPHAAQGLEPGRVTVQQRGSYTTLTDHGELSAQLSGRLAQDAGADSHPAVGDWVAARRTFEQILAMPADPISRAVALHGLGKMTIHAGDFARGLSLIEQSIATYPLPLAYRNLAVYWNSEGQVEKAQGFAERALALDPDDPYTQIFVAAFIAEDGRREEALRIAHANEDLLAASYNLAAIHSLLGHRAEALALLHRHFYDYERFDAVRAKEMKEAREDIVFTALKDDPEFIALTAKAETAQQAAQAAMARSTRSTRPTRATRPTPPMPGARALP